MIMDTLRAEIEAAIARTEKERDILDARIVAYRDVLGTMDDLAAAEPPPPPVEAAGNARERPFGTGRAPRRDVMGAVKQAVRDYMEAKGLGPHLLDVTEGASILLGGPALSESAARRALDALIGKGDMRLHDQRYATAGAPVRFGEIADAAK